ncbi:MAG: DUF4097 family beta strand repeat-containing protein [Acidimicrobiia bacterium]|nr:DUF4097 family beta strand repeat-containing protein [Acidimicrobiia bacterium]
MSDRTETHEVGGSPEVSLYLHAGDIRIKPGVDGSVTVALSGRAEALDDIEIDATDDGVAVRAPGKQRRWFGRGTIDCVLTIPEAADVTVHNGAGDVLIGVDVQDLEVHTGAGDIRADDVAGTTDLKVGSGDIRTGRLAGPSRISSAAGDVRVDAATDLTVSTAAGDLYLGDVTESARVKSATGDVRIRRFAGSDLEIKTMSGDATVGLIPGMLVNTAIKTLSGDFRNRIKASEGEKAGTMNLTITSFAGDVTLKSAP